MKDKKPQEDKIQFSLPLTRRSLKYIAAIIVMVALVYVVVTQPEKISRFISGALSVLSPFIIGFCIAYVVNLLMKPLERFWNFIWKKLKNQKIVSKLRRPICLVLSLLIVFGVIFAIMFMVIPALKETVASFADKVPQYTKTVEQWYNTVVDFLAHYNFELPEMVLDTAKITEIAKNVISSYGNDVLNTTEIGRAHV